MTAYRRVRSVALSGLANWLALGLLVRVGRLVAQSLLMVLS